MYLVKIAFDANLLLGEKTVRTAEGGNPNSFGKMGGNLGGRVSRVTPSGFEKAVEFRFGVFIVPSSNLFSKQMMSHARSAWWLETKSYARIAW